MGSIWCHAHKRMEEDTDYIDFPVSPSFLGAYYEQGLTQRRPAEIIIRPPTELEIAKLQENQPIRGLEQYGEMFQAMQEKIDTLTKEVRELKTSPVQRRGVVEQRDIDVSSGD
jgi:thymidylate synthase